MEVESEKLFKILNNILTFIERLSEDIKNTQGQLDSLQDCFKKKLLETQEPLSEDWARAELDQIHHNQVVGVDLHNELIKRVELLENEQERLESYVKNETLNNRVEASDVNRAVFGYEAGLGLCFRVSQLEKLASGPMMIAQPDISLQPGEIIPVKFTLDERITKLEHEHNKLTQLVNEVVHG